jgi:hypothetical protein
MHAPEFGDAGLYQTLLKWRSKVVIFPNRILAIRTAFIQGIVWERSRSSTVGDQRPTYDWNTAVSLMGDNYDLLGVTPTFSVEAESVIFRAAAYRRR